MTQSYDVLVIGGGIVGLTAACAMGSLGFSTALIDAGSLKIDSSSPSPRVYAINSASQTLLETLKVWPLLNKQALSPYTQMHVWDGVQGQPLDFDCRQVAKSHLGTIIDENHLKQALLQRIELIDTITLVPHCCVEEILNNQIVCQEGVWEGQLIMIADGALSPTRQKLKVPLTTWSYNQNALITTVQTAKPHQQTAYQVFNPDGPLAFLPLPHPNQCSIVWSTTPNKVQQLMAMDDEAFNDALDLAFTQHLGHTQVISPRYQFPLHMRHVSQYTGASWMLLGDAAHTIHPLAGLGLNVGLADLSAWMHLMETIKGELNSSKRLGAYQRARKHALWQVIMLMEGLKRVFGTTSPPLGLLRGLGLKACNEWSPLKRFLIEQACG